MEGVVPWNRTILPVRTTTSHWTSNAIQFPENYQKMRQGEEKLRTKYILV